MTLALSALHIYPVKGLKGIELTEALCTERGLEHDRRFMLVDPSGNFLTQRDHPRMATVWTDTADDELRLSAPDAGEVALEADPADGEPMTVQVWASTCRAIAPSSEADRWLSDYLGLPCRIVFMPDSTLRLSNSESAGVGKLVSFADGYAYLLTAESSLADLNARLAAKGHRSLPMNRFRPNLVISGSEAFAEDEWNEIRIGAAILRVAKPCGRCRVTTTDQTTGEVMGPEPLATLSTYRDSHEFGVRFGMNLVTVLPGSVRVGDRVSLG